MTIRQNEPHTILVDGAPICEWKKRGESWAQFFTCLYQWRLSAEQAAAQVKRASANKAKQVIVVKGRCACLDK